MYIVKTPEIAHRIVTDVLWKVNTTEKVLYLTFDDGPTPGVTDWVLNILDKYDAKATFFLVGKNADLYPDLVKLISKKHAIGHHTYAHPNARKVSNFHYYRDVLKGEGSVPSKFFRPPYGRLKWHQIKTLSKKFKLIYWDVISGDFDITIEAEDCYKRVVKHAGNGSIIVFHDSIKAEARLKGSLERILDYFSKQGYRFEAISSE